VHNINNEQNSEARACIVLVKTNVNIICFASWTFYSFKYCTIAYDS